MMSASVNKRTGTRIGDRGNTALSVDVVKLLKTQDAGYIRTMLQKVRKERERLEEGGFVLDEDEGEIEALGGQRSGKGAHTVFVGDKEEQKEFAPEEWFGVEDEMDLEKVWNRPRKQVRAETEEEDLEDTNGKPGEKLDPMNAKEQRTLQRKREKAQESRRSRLEALKSKEKELMAADKELEFQRAKMNNDAGGVNKNGVKFKVRERKR